LACRTVALTFGLKDSGLRGFLPLFFFSMHQ
jgi:hypothetical protein